MTKGHHGALWSLAACGVLLLCFVAVRREAGSIVLEGETLAAPEVELSAPEGPSGVVLAPPDLRPPTLLAERVGQPQRHSSVAGILVRAVVPDDLPTGSVGVILRQGSQVLARAELNEALEARFDGLPPGQYSAELDCAAQQFGLVKPLWPPTEAWKVWFELRRAEQRAVDLFLHPAASLRGTLFDAAGAPVAKAYVRLHPLGLPYGLDTPGALTDETGSFAFEGLAPGVHRVVTNRTAHVRDHAEALPAPLDVTLEPGESRWLSLQTIANPRSISGRLMDREGHPIAGVYVDCEQLNVGASFEALSVSDFEPDPAKCAHWSLRLDRVSTDEGGHFRLDGLPPVTVVVRAASVGTRVRGFKRSDPLFAMQVSEPLDLRLEEAVVELGDWVLARREAD